MNDARRGSVGAAPRHGIFLLATALTACAATTPPPPPLPSAAPVAAPCPTTPPPAPAPAGDATPDPPRPEDEAKAAELAPTFTSIVEGAPRFSPDGKRVAFTANFDGPGVYLADLDGKSAPRRVAATTGRFRRPVFSPDGKSLYFTSDSEGDEAFAIFQMALDTGAVTVVTPGEKRRRDDGPSFSKDGQRFLFSGRKMSERGIVLFEQATTPGAAPAQVFADADRELEDVRPDAKQILVTESNTPRSISVLDLPATAPARKIYPAGDPVAKNTRVGPAVYAPDGQRVFVSTDDGGERTFLLAIDVKTGHELARYTEERAPGGDVQGLVASGNSVAYVLDLGTHHELRILDARTLKARPQPKLPLGSEVVGSGHPNATSSLALSPDGARAVVQWSTPSSAPRVYVVDTKTGDVSPLTHVARPESPAIEAQVVRVKSFDGLEIPTLLYLPKDAGKHPVVMSIHGGFPYAATARFDPWIATLTARGYAVVEPNVRGSAGFGPRYESADDGVGKLNGVRDHGAVGRWIAAQPWADASRMAVMGGSAGGYYTMMAVAHYPDLWRAGVAIVPLYDLQLAVKTMDAGLRSLMEQRELVPLTETAVAAALSPSTYVDRVHAPLFVYAGAKDVRTPTEQIDELVRDVRARGGKVEYMKEEHAGHSTAGPKVRAMQSARILRFLGEALR